MHLNFVSLGEPFTFHSANVQEISCLVSFPDEPACFVLILSHSCEYRGSGTTGVNVNQEVHSVIRIYPSGHHLEDQTCREGVPEKTLQNYLLLRCLTQDKRDGIRHKVDQCPRPKDCVVSRYQENVN